MNYRICAAGEMLENLKIKSVLDIGCRNCEVKNILPSGVEYFGNDLFQNDECNVAFLGNALDMDFGRSFDCVIALDIVEHVDDPYRLIDKLVSLADKYLLVSLPNIYDLIHKYKFVVRGTLGGKYRFGVENSLDRHRWVMNYDEIHEFFGSISKKYGLNIQVKNIVIGKSSDRSLPRISSSILPLIFGKKVMTRTVLALFSKKIF